MTEWSEESLLRLGDNPEKHDLIETVPLLPSKAEIEKLKADRLDALEDALKAVNALGRTHESVVQAQNLLKVLQCHIDGKVALGLTQSLAWILEEALE